MLDYVTLQDDVAEPIMRSYMNNTSSKLESIAQSIFNSRITRQKLPGFHAAQVTGVGFNFVAGKDNGGKNSVGISKNLQYHPDGKPYIALESKGFPNFGIWSKPGAPYVCLEPWCGRCDNRGFEGELSEKPGINALKAGEVFEKSYDIIVY